MNAIERPEIFAQIIRLLDVHGVAYEHVQHAHAVSSLDTAAVTGFPVEQGAKSILFKSRDGYKLVIVRGDNRADFRKLRQHFGTNKLRLATPDEVLDVMGVSVGACFPFGDLVGVHMIVDDTLPAAGRIHFSPGTHNDHLVMTFDEYAKVTKPKLVDVVLN